jgi:non-ribosomal peptide synthetase component E (peptide arylation enzyme)
VIQPLNRIDGVVYPDAEKARFYTECGAWERRTMGQALCDAAQIAPDQVAYV